MDNRQTHTQCPSEQVCPFALTMAYVPMQQMGVTYEADMALRHGTLFPELDKPFLAAGGRGRG